MTLKTKLFFILFLIATALQAHAAKYYDYGKALKKLPPAKIVAVLPINTNGYLKPEEKQILSTHIRTYISELGFETQLKSFGSLEVSDPYMQLTTDLMGNQVQEYEDYKAQFAKSLNLKADIILFVSIEARQGTFKSGVMRWDGVSHTVITKRDGQKSGGGEWSGNYVGYSLRLQAFSPSGDYLFSSYGAISLPKYAEVSDRTWLRKENIFEDRKDLKSMELGIRKATTPLRKKVKLKK